MSCRPHASSRSGTRALNPRGAGRRAARVDPLSIGIARLSAERAKRLGVPVEQHDRRQSGASGADQAIKMKPGRSVQSYLENLLTRVLGTTEW